MFYVVPRGKPVKGASKPSAGAPTCRSRQVIGRYELPKTATGRGKEKKKMNENRRRVTVSHAVKSPKNGLCLAEHCDRDESIKCGSFDRNRSFLNIYWTHDGSGKPFKEVEKEYYEKEYSEALEAQNGRAEKSGHTERIRTMDEYRKMPQHAPTETLIYLGDVKCEDVGEEVWKDVVSEYIGQMEALYPNYKVLDWALHRDEKGANHVHLRGVFTAHDKDGRKIADRTKALVEMGVERPDPRGKRSRENNEVMTWTEYSRAVLKDIARDNGIEFTEEPQDRSKTGRKHNEYIAEQKKKEAEELTEEVRKLGERKLRQTMLSRKKPTLKDYEAREEEIEELKKENEGLKQAGRKQAEKLKEQQEVIKGQDKRIKEQERKLEVGEKKEKAYTQLITQMGVDKSILDVAMSRYMSGSMNVSFHEYVKDGIRHAQHRERDRENTYRTR